MWPEVAAPGDERGTGGGGGPLHEGAAEALDAEGVRLAALVAELQGVLAGIDATREAAGATDDEHDPEGVTIAVERAQVVSRLEVAARDTERLAEARCRIDEGRYGRCAGCGAPIGAERLAALPAVETCVACARRGHGGDGLGVRPAPR